MRERDKSSGRADVFVRPRYLVFENVPGILTSNKYRDFQTVLTEVVRIVRPDSPDVPLPDRGWPKSGCLMGYGDSGCPFSIAYRLHDAQFWGAALLDDDGAAIHVGTPQRRKRIALVADFGGFTASEILFIKKGLHGDFAEKQGEE